MGVSSPILTYWYFHLPNFILAALMYTLLGRAVLGLVVGTDSTNYIWRFFCRITDPFVMLIAALTPKATAPVVLWLLGCALLFGVPRLRARWLPRYLADVRTVEPLAPFAPRLWLRVGLLYLFLLLGAVPSTS